MSEQATLTAIDEDAGLWSIDLFTKSRWHLRTTVVASGGGVVVISPTRGTSLAIGEALDRLGPVRVLLAPNHFHNMGLREYRDRYPDARVMATSAASARVAKKSGIEIEPLDLGGVLPAGCTVIEPPGLKTGEVWLRLLTGRGLAWIVTDSFFNLPNHPSGVMGLACRMLAVSPGLRVSRTYRRLAIADLKVHREWLYQQIERDRPSVLVPAHGEVEVSDQLPEKLRAAAQMRLGE